MALDARQKELLSELGQQPGGTHLHIIVGSGVYLFVKVSITGWYAPRADRNFEVMQMVDSLYNSETRYAYT